MSELSFQTQYEYAGEPQFRAPLNHTARDSRGFIYRQTGVGLSSLWEIESLENKPSTILWAHENYLPEIGADNQFGTHTGIAGGDINKEYMTAMYLRFPIKRIYGLMYPMRVFTSGQLSIKAALFSTQKLNAATCTWPYKVIEGAKFQLEDYDPSGAGMIKNQPIFIPLQDRVSLPLDMSELSKIYIHHTYKEAFSCTVMARKLADFGTTSPNDYRQDRILTAAATYSTQDYSTIYDGDIVSETSNGSSGTAGAFQIANTNFGLVVDLC